MTLIFKRPVASAIYLSIVGLVAWVLHSLLIPTLSPEIAAWGLAAFMALDITLGLIKLLGWIGDRASTERTASGSKNKES